VADSVQTRQLFSTPLVVGRIDDPEMNASLEAAILAKRQQHPGVLRSNTGGGWHSDTALLSWGGDAARRLADHILELANAGTMHVGGKQGRFGWRLEGWANVSEHGSANARHVHGGCYWSAVYYLRVDEGTGGNLVLHDTRMPTLAMHAPYLRFRNAQPERDIKIKPEVGKLLLFPAWLPHEVEPWQGDGLRISIAVNVTAVRQEQMQGSVEARTGLG
jgi:uncharacterized protein (TIGR02466 family)